MLVDPSHKVRQGGKGSVLGWTDVGTDRWTLPDHFWPTSGPLPTTSGSLPVHLGIIGGHIRHHSYSSPKKMNFPKSADIRTDGHTDIKKKK